MSHEELKELKVRLEELLAKGYVKLSKSLYGIVMTFLVRECYGSPKKQEF
jgi:hypothetical protein